MKSRDVFSFIDKLFAKGLLPQGRNLWGIAYNIDDCTGAVKLAEKNGMELWVFKRWMVEYARRKAAAPSLFLPVAMRWGIEDRPQRAVVKVPIGSMKDFDNLSDAAVAELMIELNADADEELYVRDMRAPDAPDVWARVVIDGVEQEVTFNPVKLGRGDTRLAEGCDDLKKVQVLEWHTAEDTASKKKEVVYTARKAADAPTDAAPALSEVQNISTKESIAYGGGCIAFCLVVLFLLIKGCCSLMTPDEAPLPHEGDYVTVCCKKSVTGWTEAGNLRQYDREKKEGNADKARQLLRKEREQDTARPLPSGEKGRVLKVTKASHETVKGAVHCVLVAFEQYGTLWLRSSDLTVTKKPQTASRPVVGEKRAAKHTAAVFSNKEDLQRMITMAARNQETASAFLFEQASRGRAFILDADEEVAIIEMDGWLEPCYLVQRLRDGRTGWMHCVAFE